MKKEVKLKWRIALVALVVAIIIELLPGSIVERTWLWFIYELVSLMLTVIGIWKVLSNNFPK